MAQLLIDARVERWPVAGSFVIARGAKTYVDVVVAGVALGGAFGEGEGTPIYYHGETAEGAVAAIMRAADRLAPLDPTEARGAVQVLLPPGAARNALDCALWDLEAKLAGRPLWQLAGLAEPRLLVTAFTISLGEPATMEEHARIAAARGFGLLKLKLTGEGDTARVAAVRRGAPSARLIVDANESWAGRDWAGEAAALAAFGVEMIEQPLPADTDDALAGAAHPLPFVADESCHVAADVARLADRYDGFNLKLDKAGGLTEGLALAAATRAAGRELMVGCMLSTSRGIAPAFLVAQGARWVDLDGPALLAEDREGGFRFDAGRVIPPAD